jgi:hypothetical protein
LTELNEIDIPNVRQLSDNQLSNDRYLKRRTTQFCNASFGVDCNAECAS